MPRIQANRDSIDDRFSVLGFSVRTESPLFEVAVATDPGLFRAERRAQRSRRNFYSSRGIGVIRARRGEAVYLVPPEVLANFVGQPKLYFGLATYRENSRGKPDYVQSPGEGNVYVNLSGLTERGLRRLSLQRRNGASYGGANGQDPSLDWGGDSVPQAAPSPSAASSSSAAPVTSTTPGSPAPAPYDDGFGSFPEPQTVDTTAPAASTSSPRAASRAVAPAPSATTPPLAVAQELLLKPYGGGDSGLLEQLGFLLSGVVWVAGVDDTTGFPHSAICRIYSTMADGEYVGTGFYVGRNVLLTAAHMVHGATRIVVVPGKNGAGKDAVHEPFGRFTATADDWVEHGSYRPDVYDFDLAVVRASQPAPNDRWFPLEELRESRPEGVVVCGYSTSSDQKDKWSRRVNMVIDSEKQHLHSGHIRFMDTEETFDYDVQTLPGASGGPVYSILAGNTPTAVVCGVHVAGGGSDSTNQGCRLTDAKIAWIRARAAELGVASPMSLRSEAPAARAQKAVSRAASIARSRPQGMFDVLPVDLKLRVFIPAPAVVGTLPVVGGDIPLQDAHGGDGRGFQQDGGTSRAEITAKFHFGGDDSKPRLSDITRKWGESKEFDIADTAKVPGKPDWWRSVREGAVPKKRGTLTLTGDNLSIAMGGSANDGIASMAENAVVTTLEVHGADPLLPVAPEIDATLAVLLKVDGDRVKVRVRGGHDEFPAYELYANGVLIYSYDPVAAGGSPWGLLGDGNWDVNPDTDYVDVGPASEYRLIGPVRIKDAQAQAQAVIEKVRALSEQSIAVHWDTVAYYPQSSGASCWAAAAAMIVGWRDNRSVADTEIAGKVPVFNAYKTGLFPSARRALADAWNLVPEPPACYTIESWAQMLQAYGPIYVDMTWDTSDNGGHARVLVGMESDGAADGSGTTMYMHDPWPGTPGKIKLPFADFLALYEGRTGNEGGQLQYQILHSDRVPAGRQSVTAAPFALTTSDDATPQNEKSGIVLAPAPAPVGFPEGALAREQGAVVGVIVGEVVDALKNRIITRLTDEGDLSYTVDSYEGLIHPNGVPPDPPLPAKQGRSIEIKDWPKVQVRNSAVFSDDVKRFPGTGKRERPDVLIKPSGELHSDVATPVVEKQPEFGFPSLVPWRDVFANFVINWSYTGVSVGDVSIERTGSQKAPGIKLQVTAKIRHEDYQGKPMPYAKALVHFDYEFVGRDDFHAIGSVDVRLFGNGTRTIEFAWMQ